MKDFKIGTDPEFFLKKGRKFVSAILFIGDREHGTKHNPIKMPCGATIQRDNVAVEIATVPATTEKEFVDSINTAMLAMSSMIPKGYIITITPSALFPASELEHPEAMEFGCDPDFNAWNMKQNVISTCFSSRLRTCGAHVHVSHPFLEPMENKIRMIRMMDVYLGLFSVLSDNSKAAKRRKKLYGKAGAYRPTKYPDGSHGVEYRTLSNFWISSDDYIRRIFRLSISSLETCINNKDEHIITLLNGGDKIQEIINKGQTEDALIATEVIYNG